MKKVLAIKYDINYDTLLKWECLDLNLKKTIRQICDRLYVIINYNT